MDDLELLTRVRERLARTEAWTQGERARNAAGWRCDPRSAYAVSWCVLGAAIAVGSDDEQIVEIFGDVAPHTNIVAFNDTRTHAEVLARLDAAIKERSHAG